jgi:outer membrane protein OmpA-like peptidoglycan-associated protein
MAATNPLIRSLLPALALALGACASVAPPAPGAGAPARPAADAALAKEHRWLSQLFAGTPVEITLQRDGQLAVEVPLDFSFDAGRANVKPPLAKVLDYLAQSATRQITTRLHVAAPADTRGAPALALRRAAAVRAYLAGKGVSPQRFSEPVAAERGGVSVRVEPAPG